MRNTAQNTVNTEEYVSRAYETMCTRRSMIPKLEDEVRSIRKRMRMCKGPAEIHTYRTLSKQVDELNKQITEYASGDETRSFFERVRPLMSLKQVKVPTDCDATGADAADEEGDVCMTREPDSGTVVCDPNVVQQREALAMSLFHPKIGVPIFIQTDRCTLCDADLRLHEDGGAMVCPSCHRLHQFLQLGTDHVDVDYVAQDTHANHVRATHTGNVDNMHGVDKSYPKVELFRQYIMQFSASVAPPPPHVMEEILRELSKVHIRHSGKVQSTHVVNILKKRGLKQYSWMSMRISMMLRCHVDSTASHIPVFSQELQTRLVKRFEVLLRNMKARRCRNRRKMFNLRFLTKLFLYQEGEHAMCAMFDNHKTRAVIRREDALLSGNYKILESEMKEHGFKWRMFRSV